MISYAREQEVEFLVLDKSPDLPTRYPDLAPLVSPRFHHPDLEIVYSRMSPNGQFFVIYRIKPPALSHE